MESSFESNEEKHRIWRTTRNLSPSACYRENNHCSLDCEDSNKGTVFGEFLNDCSCTDLYYQEKRDDLTCYLREQHLSQPENEKDSSLGDYVAARSKTNDWFMCIISEINDPSKEVKVRFMRKSGQYLLLSKKLEKWFPKPAIFHRCSKPSIDNRLRYSFDAISTKGM